MKKFRVTFNSPVILGFVFACLIVTILGSISRGRITEMFFMTFRGPISSPMTYVRLFTHVFGHSGWQHFLGNASYLLLIGTILEDKYGSKTICLIIAITALVTGLVNNLLFANVGLCGASGVVFAFILLASFTGFKEGEIPLTFILITIIFIGQQLYEGIAIKDNISNLAHIVGGLVGAIAGYLLNKEKEELE